MFVRTIYALGQEQTAAAGADPNMGFFQFIPLILVFGVFYFLIIRPQQQKQKKHQELINTLKKGDKVVTVGGILGTVYAIKDENTISLEIGSGVKVDVLKKSLSSLQSSDESLA